MYRRRKDALEVFLVHPGGPYFQKKDPGAWTIPKGEPLEGESPLETALREFFEETGKAADGPFADLGETKQAGGKTVRAWAFAGDWEDGRLPVSNDVEIEWPPRSGRKIRFPEIDRAAFFPVDEARRKIHPAQVVLIDRLERTLREE